MECHDGAIRETLGRHSDEYDEELTEPHDGPARPALSGRQNRADLGPERGARGQRPRQPGRTETRSPHPSAGRAQALTDARLRSVRTGPRKANRQHSCPCVRPPRAPRSIESAVRRRHRTARLDARGAPCRARTESAEGTEPPPSARTLSERDGFSRPMTRPVCPVECAARSRGSSDRPCSAIVPCRPTPR